jgi:uncharacterized protein YyaL (SSP411 family)
MEAKTNPESQMQIQKRNSQEWLQNTRKERETPQISDKVQTNWNKEPTTEAATGQQVVQFQDYFLITNERQIWQRTLSKDTVLSEHRLIRHFYHNITRNPNSERLN